MKRILLALALLGTGLVGLSAPKIQVSTELMILGLPWTAR
jgi:hypothetical protein